MVCIFDCKINYGQMLQKKIHQRFAQEGYTIRATTCNNIKASGAFVMNILEQNLRQHVVRKLLSFFTGERKDALLCVNIR